MSDTQREAGARATAIERARWCAVLSSPEAAGRLPLACSLLADSSASAEKIRAALLTAPVSCAAGAAHDTAAQFLHVQRKVTGAYVPPLQGVAARIVRAYRRTVGSA
jgi:hypothetical protein